MLSRFSADSQQSLSRVSADSQQSLIRFSADSQQSQQILSNSQQIFSRFSSYSQQSLSRFSADSQQTLSRFQIFRRFSVYIILMAALGTEGFSVLLHIAIFIEFRHVFCTLFHILSHFICKKYRGNQIEVKNDAQKLCLQSTWLMLQPCFSDHFFF